VQERKAARELSDQIDDLMNGARPDRGAGSPTPAADELAVARHLREISAHMSPVPVQLERRVRAIVGAPPVPRGRSWSAAATGALVAAAVFVLLWITVPGGQMVGADMVRALLGQTRVELTPTLDSELPSREVREPLSGLLAAEITMGRAPSLPRALPEGHSLQEVAAVSYPDLPSWISQPLFVELCYGLPGQPPALKLRQYRLLFRQFGGISGVQVAGDAVAGFEQVEVAGAPGTLLTTTRNGTVRTVLWERDGLLLELESETLSRDELLRIAQSVR
jgi:hypothetical protein